MTTPANTAASVVLQTVPLDRPTPLRPLYWRRTEEVPDAAPPQPDGQGGLLVPPGALVAFDTYFGAFFEYHWRVYAKLRSLTLCLDVDGAAWLRVWRRTHHGGTILLHEQHAAGPVAVTLPQDAAHFRQNGLLWFDVTALDRPAILSNIRWTTTDSPAEPVGLGVAICTFNRENELSAVLARIAGHAPLDAVARVIVVNQGRPGLQSHVGIARAAELLGPRLRVVEQGNLGGAGGFGRGLIEALDDPSVTHVCFLDDDVVLEPDSLLRMAAFFGLAHNDVAVGGHMLDSVQPTVLYEAGAVVLANWALQPVNGGIDLRDPGMLIRLLDSKAVHFNGWWMFGFPKGLVQRLNMPLPCFIRGDDVEFGVRLHENAVATVPLPGVGIWHEPFYLKIGGWQLYYEVRNALVCAALHQDFTPRRVAVLTLKRLLIQLLTYRYYNAALTVRGIEDFLRGPRILEQDPRPLHASLNELRQRYPQEWTRRDAVLPDAPVGPSPRSVPGFVAAMAQALCRNGLRASRPGAAPARLDSRDLVWFRVMGLDALAVDTHWDAELPTFRRDRDSFRALFSAGLHAIWRLYRAAPALQQTMRDAAPRLTSVAFWREYVARP